MVKSSGEAFCSYYLSCPGSENALEVRTIKLETSDAINMISGERTSEGKEVRNAS